MEKPQPPASFHTTQWSVVISAREDSQNDSALRRSSLEKLCSVYWLPLFTYLRRKGYGPEDSADYVQGFFSELIEKDYVRAVAKDRGRFRWFLMSAVTRYVSKQVEGKLAIKRGGNATVFSIDFNQAEKSYLNEPVDGWTAEKVFDRRWALTVLQQTLEQLETKYEKLDQAKLFERLRPFLIAGGGEQTYQEIASELQKSEGSIKVAAVRMRERYRQTLRSIVSETLADEESLEDEIDVLLSSLRGDL